MAQQTQRRVGTMVAALIRVTGRTITDAAAHLGIHRNSLADKIAGRRPFTEDEILALAGFFEVTPAQLFEDPRQLLGVSPAQSRCIEVPRHLTLATAA